MTFFARAVFVLLVGATFFAFFAAQRLKSAPPVAKLVGTARYFSPNEDGRRDTQRYGIQVQESDDVTLTVVDRDGNDVRRIATAVPADPDQPLRAIWDGTGSDGRRAPDGRYLLRANLRKLGRAVTLHPGVYLDTTRADADRLRGRRRRALDHRAGGQARPVPRARRLVTPADAGDACCARTADRRARWRPTCCPAACAAGSGTGRRTARRRRPGPISIAAAVRDTAGNVGRSAPVEPEPGTIGGRPGVSVRRLLAQPPVDPVRTGERARFAVDSRGRPFTWNIRRVGADRPVRRGRARTGGDLSVELPTGRAGVYLLAVRAGSDFTRVPFAVQDAEPAPILVVLPGITWFGREQLDDDRDGLPNTLDNGGPADYPRLLASGLPRGFTAQVAPMLAFLDRQGIGYDVTTDLTLAATRRGLSEERAGVLLPGPLRWVPTGLAGRLRRYVDSGGRLAMFGADSLRRGVDVGRSRLLRPLPPTDGDPFGITLRPLRRLAPGADPLQPIADEGNTGLLTGVQSLSGFTAVEESDGREKVQSAIAAVDMRRPGPPRRRPARRSRRATRRWRCRASGRGPSSGSGCPSGAGGSPPAARTSSSSRATSPTSCAAPGRRSGPTNERHRHRTRMDSRRRHRAGRGARGRGDPRLDLARPGVRDARRAGAHAGAADPPDLEHAAAGRPARASGRAARRRRRGGRGGRGAARRALRAPARGRWPSPCWRRFRSACRSRRAARRPTCSCRSTS